jgi:hypothetical protein
VLPLYQQVFPRSVLKPLIRAAGVTLYWRVLTPLVILWGLIYQRLNADHTCDAAVSYLRSGAVDDLDQADRHEVPLSRRLRSESTSAYVQGRQRLPLAVVQAALHTVAHQIETWLWPSGAGATEATWHGRRVRLLDGTTFRLRPEGDLVTTYGQAPNQHSRGYWVVVKSVAAFCLHARMCLSYAEGPQTTSEPALAVRVLRQDPHLQSVYVGDRVFGVYRVAQVAQALGQYVLLRLEERTAKRLWRQATGSAEWHSGQECQVAWWPTPETQVEPGLPLDPVQGRVMFVRLVKPGFRPIALHLFTTLLARDEYPIDALVALYGLRWEVELDYRHLKTTLEMATFEVRSAAMFRLELAVGLLTYNLICALMVTAARQTGVSPMQLSFSRCLRRVREVLTRGVPNWVRDHASVFDYLLQQLARCRLPCQLQKAKHEPRKVRHRPWTFPVLHGPRTEARQECLAQMAAQSVS